MKRHLFLLFILCAVLRAEPPVGAPTLAPEDSFPPPVEPPSVFQATKQAQEGIDSHQFSVANSFTAMNEVIEKCVVQDGARYTQVPFRKMQTEDPDRLTANHRQFSRCVRAATLEFTRKFGAAVAPERAPKICAD